MLQHLAVTAEMDRLIGKLHAFFPDGPNLQLLDVMKRYCTLQGHKGHPNVGVNTALFSPLSGPDCAVWECVSVPK